MPAAQQAKIVKVGAALAIPKGANLRAVKVTSAGGAKSTKASRPSKEEREARAREREALAVARAAEREEAKRICDHVIAATRRVPASYQKWDAIRTRAWITLVGVVDRAAKDPSAKKLDRLRALKIIVDRFERMSQVSCGQLIDQGAEGIWKGTIQ